MKELIVTIKDGAIVNRSAVSDFFSIEDGDYALKLTPYRQRSLKQNAYFHKVVVPMVFDGLRESGHDDVKTFDDAKWILKDLFAKQSILNEKTNKYYNVVKDTSSMTIVEFMFFLVKVQKWALEYLNIFIPDPVSK